MSAGSREVERWPAELALQELSREQPAVVILRPRLRNRRRGLPTCLQQRSRWKPQKPRHRQPGAVIRNPAFNIPKRDIIGTA